MIQRIQTIYLLLSAILFSFLISGVIMKFSGGLANYQLTLSGIKEISESDAVLWIKTIPLAVSLFLIPVLSIATVFMYKKRKLQTRLCLAIISLIILSVIIGGSYIFGFTKSANASLIMNFKLIVLPFSLLLTYLAYKAIMKDENLVKSYDRLR